MGVSVCRRIGAGDAHIKRVIKMAGQYPREKSKYLHFCGTEGVLDKEIPKTSKRRDIRQARRAGRLKSFFSFR
jgi:hypothetical protein